MPDGLCLSALQPQNILLTSARPLGDIRIVDFGLSRHMDSITEVREILGTPEYVGEPRRTQCCLCLCGSQCHHIVTEWQRAFVLQHQRS